MTKTLSPKDLWDKLLNLDPKNFLDTMPDIDMLHHAFEQQPDRIESVIAKNAFKNAINHWNDDQIHEFFQFMSDEKLPTEITSAQLHSGLKTLYQKIFEV